MSWPVCLSFPCCCCYGKPGNVHATPPAQCIFLLAASKNALHIRAMSSGCRSFSPNFWRPSTCANCYQQRSRHTTVQDSHDMERKTNSKNRAELSRSAESVTVKVPVEPVKPYAVVKIADGQDTSSPRGSRERWPRAAALLCRLKPNGGRRKLVSPPPPSSRQTAAEAKRCSVKKKSSTLATDIPFTAERAHYSKLPPEKPPRTLSTFLTEAERDAFLEYANRPNNDMKKQQEDEEFSAASTRVAYADSGQLHKEIAGLVAATLRDIASESTEKILCSENLWNKADWSWVQRVSGSKIVYKGAAFTVEEVSVCREEEGGMALLVAM